MRSRGVGLSFVIVLLACTLSVAARAAPVTVDFESLTDGDSLSTQIPGLTFSHSTVLTAGVSLNEIDFPPSSGTNVIFDDGGALTIEFAVPVFLVSGRVTYLAPVTLSLFDAALSLIGANTSAFSSNAATVGDAGSAPNELLSFSGIGIRRAVFSAAPGGSSLTLDDLTFDMAPPTSVVPEPASFLLLLVGLLCCGLTLGKRVRGAKPVLLQIVSPIAAVVALPANAAVVLGAPSASPSAVIENNPTPVLFTLAITDPSVIKTGVTLQRVDDNDKAVAVLGSMRDDGTAGDAVAGDNVYSLLTTVTIPAEGYLRARASVAVKGQIVRVPSGVVRLDAHASLTVMNETRDFAGDNVGNAIYLHWSNLPSGTTRVLIARAGAPDGPWTPAFDLNETSETPSSAADEVNGSLQDWYYQLQAFSATGALLRTYPVLRVPKDSPPCTAGSSTTPWNEAFISNDKFSDKSAMTLGQIRELLHFYGSVLDSKTLADDDGVTIDPAQLIFAAAQAWSVNPQVLIATIQKESSLIKNANLWSTPPKDGYLGVKKANCKTFRCQLSSAAEVLSTNFAAAQSGGTTTGGWKVGVDHAVDYSPTRVTPANAATASLFNYTPVIGNYWKADTNLGTSAFVNLWENWIFNDLVFALKWQTCGACPATPEVSIDGNAINVGIAGRPESGTQAVAVHGASGQLPGNKSYTIKFDFALFTWDSYNQATSTPGTGYWDSFSVGTNSTRYWLTSRIDPITPTPPFIYGGKLFGDASLEKSSSGGGARTITVPAAPTSYLNVVLDTATLPESDSNYPSWGTFKVVSAKANACVRINEMP